MRLGGVTLFLGAGVSVPYGVPTWPQLARRVWGSCFPDRTGGAPWEGPHATSLQSHPQFLSMLFELIFNEVGEDRFLSLMEQNLYRDVDLPSQREIRGSRSSLAAIARAVCSEYRRGALRRIVQVITLNIDDLLTELVMNLGPGNAADCISRPTRLPALGTGDQPIPVYHVHGVVPYPRSGATMRARLRATRRERAKHQMVFTDYQYWRSIGSPLSYVNSVVTHAMFESRCVFIGLSMTDINILRWLGHRAWAVATDVHEWASRRGDRRSIENPSQSAKKHLIRHFWIRPESDDPGGILGDFLELRGVRSVPIESWTDGSFSELLEGCLEVE